MNLGKFLISVVVVSFALFFLGGGFTKGWNTDHGVMFGTAYLIMGFLTYVSNLADIRMDVENRGGSKLIQLMKYIGYWLACVTLWFPASVYNLAKK